MKFLVKLFVVIGALLSFTSVNAQENPYELANTVANNTIVQIKANKNSLSDRAVAEKVINENLMPYIDVKYAAYKVIGTSLKNTTAQQREDFTKAFAENMKNSFIKVLTKYTSQEIIPSAIKEVPEDETLVSVKMNIHEEGKKDLELVLKLRKNKKTNAWKAYDMVAENISMLESKVSEISPIIKNQGIEKAIEILNNPETK